MKPDFIRFLSLFRFNLRYVHTGIEDGQLAIRLRGPWLHVILFEVPLLAIVSEVRNRYRYREVVLEQVGEQLYRKLDWLSAQASSEELAEFQVAASAPAGASPTAPRRKWCISSSATSPGASSAPATCTWPASTTSSRSAPWPTNG